MQEMLGTCMYCGQTKIVKAQTQEEANEMTTLDCSCPGGEMVRRKKQVEDQLDQLIGELAPDNGWDAVKPEVYRTISELAAKISEVEITSCTIRIDETNLRITRTKGRINIERSKTIRQGGSIEK